MTLKCSVYIATSVDGFIARPDGDIDWLHRPEYADLPTPGLTYDDFIATVDTLVMGRNTFEKALSFDPWPYVGMPVVVLSHRPLDIPVAAAVRQMAGSPAEIVAQLAAEGRQHLYIDGGATIQQFLRAGLIDDLTITFIPLLLGEGISLFGSLGMERSLQVLSVHSASSGLVQVRYRAVEAQAQPTRG